MLSLFFFEPLDHLVGRVNSSFLTCTLWTAVCSRRGTSSSYHSVWGATSPLVAFSYPVHTSVNGSFVNASSASLLVCVSCAMWGPWLAQKHVQWWGVCSRVGPPNQVLLWAESCLISSQHVKRGCQITVAWILQCVGQKSAGEQNELQAIYHQ